MLPYAGDLSAANIHVQAPTPVIFLCGGAILKNNASPPLSLRDAFLKIVDNPALRNRLLILAEDITRLSFFSDHYKDLLQFETDLAQITELILLFCESEGSLAELGAFSMVDEIAARLLVIIRDRHWTANSFVRLGPLRSLERNHGADAIFVVDDLDIGMDEKSAGKVKIEILKERLQAPLLLRLENTRREPTTFDEGRAGHVIKLVVGLIQEYGALTIGEIVELLRRLNVNRPPEVIAAYLLCATAVKWIVEQRKGSTTYYFALNLPDAATLVSKEDAAIKNKERRRLRIREHWRLNDGPRDRGIREIFGRSAP